MAVERPFKQGSRYKDRREHIRNKSDKERNGETLDRSRPEQEQEHRGNQGRQMGIDQRDEDAAETCNNSGQSRFAGAQFFANALEKQNVRIDANTDRQNDDRNHGQWESSTEIRQGTQE